MMRAQCIVQRDGQILMAKHRMNGDEWWCLPGGGVLPDETAAEAARRELKEECCVTGQIVRQTSAYSDDSGNDTVTFLVEIGDQEPHRGADPEFPQDDQILREVRWMKLAEICERDRAYLWAAGLLCVPTFREDVSSWGDALSYPPDDTKV
jgi:ADP-ribose pyrophosphatase YjhB (NUDIX family)